MKLKKLVQQILESNEEFKKATDAQKRVIVAKDCIARIKIKQFKPDTLTVLEIDEEYYDEKTDISIQAELCKEGFECIVCAKGGLFMGYVGRINNLNFNQIENETEHYSPLIKKLLEIFTDEQLMLIEAAFEGQQVVTRKADGTIYYIDDDVLEKAYNFYEKYYDSEERLIQICKNIIKNKGTFEL